MMLLHKNTCISDVASCASFSDTLLFCMRKSTSTIFRAINLQARDQYRDRSAAFVVEKKFVRKKLNLIQETRSENLPPPIHC